MPELPFSHCDAQLTAFLGSMGVMEGRRPDEIQQKFSDLFVPLIFVNWKVWPIVQVSTQ